MQAIVLAGGTEDDKWAKQHGVKNKAFLPINDLPMINYVVAALRACSHIEHIVVVGPVDTLADLLPYEDIKYLPEQGDIIDNVLAAVKELPQNKKVLICTSDIPMLTPEALNSLFVAVSEREADFYYPIINRTDCEQSYPGVKRTYVKLKDGSFTGGNIVVVNPQQAIPLAQIFRKLVAERKQPLKMLLTLGFSGVVFISMLGLGMLTVAGLERRLSRILGIRGAAIHCAYPEIGTDVDKDSDLELVRRVLMAGN